MSFNTREYEWSDITVVFGGVDLTGIRAVKCKKKREVEEIFGKGREPKALQSGNSSYEGEIEMLQSDFHALEVAAGGNILDVNVDVIVAYGDPSNGDVMKIKKISGIRILEVEESGKQGDKFMPVTLPFKALGMKNVS